jgi:hypothetical protein
MTSLILSITGFLFLTKLTPQLRQNFVLPGRKFLPDDHGKNLQAVKQGVTLIP